MGARIIITVPKRPTFGDAYYALQRRFDSGSHKIEVTDAQLAELKGDPVITVVELTEEQKPAKKAEKSAPAADLEVEAKGDAPAAAPADESKPEPKAEQADKPAPKGPGRRRATT